MNRVTDVVRHLLIINVLVFFGSYLLDEIGINRLMLAVFYPSPETDFFRPYQLVTHMFMHANINHLFFNMLGLFFFGPPLEALWGSKRFLFYYFFTGFGALFLHLLFMYVELNYLGVSKQILGAPMLGASGAIFGLLAGYATNFPNNVISLIFPPISMKAKYFVLIYGGIELFLGLGRFNTGIAHFAHLGGAVFGFLLIQYWLRYGTRL